MSELDGLKQGPINHGEYLDENWLDVAVPAIQKRISAYSSNEIKFNLMAVTKDPRVFDNGSVVQALGDDSVVADIDDVRVSLREKRRSLKSGGMKTFAAVTTTCRLFSRCFVKLAGVMSFYQPWSELAR